jgi:TolA-binding protein/ferric-dicitrate binding protein FerR (iron transport regulator)
MPTPISQDDLIAIAHEPEGELARRHANAIAADPALSAELARMRRTLGTLKTPVPEASHAESVRARNRFLAGASQSARGLLWKRPLWAAFGFGALLLAALSIWMLSGAPLDRSTDKPNLLALRPAHPDATPLSGEIQGLHGGAMYRVGASEPQTLTRDKPLQTGLAISLDEGGSLFSQLRKGVTLLANDATLTFVRLDDKDIIIDLMRGSVAIKVAPLGKDQTLIVRTPEMTAAVTGTYFAIVYQPETGNVVVVREGSVAVTPHAKPEQRVIVDAGYVFLLDSSLMAVKSKLQQPDKTDRFFVPSEPRDWRQFVKDQAGWNPAGDLPPRNDARTDTTDENTVAKPTGTEPGAAPDAAELLKRARLSQAERRFDAALGDLDELLTRFPKSAERDDALYLKAENLLGLGQTEAALAVLGQVESMAGRDDLKQAALYTRGHLLQERKKDYAGAQAAWQSYLSKYPNGMLREDALYGLCANRTAAGDPGNAKERCSEFVKAYPKSSLVPQALIMAGDGAWQIEDYDYAALYYGLYAGTDRSEQRPYALLRQAESLVKVDKPKLAVHTLNKFLAENPDHPEAARARALLESLE